MDRLEQIRDYLQPYLVGRMFEKLRRRVCRRTGIVCFLRRRICFWRP